MAARSPNNKCCIFDQQPGCHRRTWRVAYPTETSSVWPDRVYESSLGVSCQSLERKASGVPQTCRRQRYANKSSEVSLIYSRDIVSGGGKMVKMLVVPPSHSHDFESHHDTTPISANKYRSVLKPAGWRSGCHPCHRFGERTPAACSASTYRPAVLQAWIRHLCSGNSGGCVYMGFVLGALVSMSENMSFIGMIHAGIEGERLLGDDADLSYPGIGDVLLGLLPVFGEG